VTESEAQPAYEIRFTADAADDVSKLDGSVKKRLRKVLKRKLAADPEGYGTPLKGPLAGYWKHEFASHRIIYRIYTDQQLAVVCAVGARRGTHARDVYEQFEAMAMTGKVAEQVAAVLQSILRPKK
jgi:mRNA-degrading endonuclease RelE of RelBE toxin-antitoxin system